MHRLLPILLLLSATAHATPRPVVLELFTSQGCSSCPPADSLLADLAITHPDVLPLDFHVDYWDRLNWRDPFSLQAATARQRTYAAALGSEVYTPQLVIDGQAQAVGSNRAAVMAAIEAARAARAEGPTLTLTAHGAGLAIALGAGSGGNLLLVGYDNRHVTQIGSGENAGRTQTEVNVVRSVRALPAWSGAAITLTVPRPTGEQAQSALDASPLSRWRRS